ncbi:hypothetical protein GCM10023165_35830 [Variovorax defluvii]|uniref:Uncharacterized protein n=1 Tax=Variovorax defluvii TaxID=913761 RepID=A0ABP8I1K1_9BURK
MTRFTVSVGDDPEHEDLTAEIYYDDAYVAMVSQEAGFDNAIIEIQPGPDLGRWSFPMSEFIQALDHARQRLWELRRS